MTDIRVATARRPVFWRRAEIAIIVMLATFETFGADIALTGFGTLGLARSDANLPYLRYIDDSGTLKADSVVGVQVEAQFSPEFGAAAQLVGSFGSPSRQDDAYGTQVRWAFLSYRPSSQWLFRLGRLRTPFFIHTQNSEVGITYENARLPVEVYSLSPIYDFDGLAFSRSWLTDDLEANVDGYWGTTNIKLRLPQRDGSEPLFVPTSVRTRGIVLSLNSGRSLVRAGFHRGVATFDQTKPVETFVATAPFAPAPPPFGGALYLPFNPLDKLNLTVVTAGLRWARADWEFVAEYGQRIVDDTKIGLDSKGVYTMASYKHAAWTPYVAYARLLSGNETRSIRKAVESTPVPLLAQGAPLFLPANYHTRLADIGYVFDQYSTMIGVSYSFSATSKLKFEWMRTKVGLGSTLFDGDASRKAFHIMSASYAVAF